MGERGRREKKEGYIFSSRDEVMEVEKEVVVVVEVVVEVDKEQEVMMEGEGEEVMMEG